jgi:hypothetical protein
LRVLICSQHLNKYAYPFLSIVKELPVPRPSPEIARMSVRMYLKRSTFQTFP